MWQSQIDTKPFAECSDLKVGNGYGFKELVPLESVKTLYEVDDTVQFVFSMGDPTRRLAPKKA